MGTASHRASAEPSLAGPASPAWGPAAQAMYRAAQAAAHPGGPALMADLVRTLAEILGAAAAFVAVFGDASRCTLHTLAAVLDGKTLQNFDYTLAGTPCAQVVGHAFRYVARGVAAEFGPDTIFAAKGMDAYAAFPLNGRDGRPLGLLVAMDRAPIADAALAEALLKIFAGRIVAEIERERAEAELRAAALAVSSARGESVFSELARYLATVLHVELAFVSRPDRKDPDMLRILAQYRDGHTSHEAASYRLQGTPCSAVYGQQFRAWPTGLRRHFAEDPQALLLGADSYAGVPLNDSAGAPLGVIAIASRRPLAQLERVESMLQIFAVRAAAELEQLRATEALRRSEASYRAIFEATEDAIFVHDWDSGAIVDVNPKACANYGYRRDELLQLTVGDLSSGEEPYTQPQALQRMALAKLDRCPPFEWHRRSRDGRLAWDELHLKPLHIDGRPHILAIARDVTERKAALAALQAREQQYRAIFDGSADAMGLWNGQLRLADVNQAFTRLSGWTREDVIGRPLSERAGEPEVAQRMALIRGALAGVEGRIEAQVPGKGGQRFEVEVRYVPVRFGGEAYALSVARDITERNAALRALRAQEQKYRSIFDSSVDSMVLWDRRLRVVDVNDAFVLMTGILREQAIGRHWSERPDAHDMPRLLGYIEAALQGRVVQAIENVSRADGSRFEIELRYLPVRFGDEVYALGVGRDVSDRLERERRLRDSEAHYRVMFDASADALMLWNSRLQRVDVNPAHQKIFGYARDEVVGRAFEGLSYPDEMVDVRLRMLRRALAGDTCRAELEALRKDGRRIATELRAIPVQYRGEPHVLQIARDITERRTAEAERERLEAQLRQAQKMEAIGQLTGGIAHDFNNILTSVIGYLVLGQERAERLADATLQRQLGQAQLAAQRARQLIAQMLAFARRQRGQRQVLALAPLVPQTLQLLRATLPSSVTVDCQLPAAGAQALQVLADPVQLEQVLFNLCINARDAIGGPGAIRVRLGHRGGGWTCASCRLHVPNVPHGPHGPEGGWVELSVADDGGGIAPEVLERMFEPFFSTKQVGQGSGMGLAMVHGIVHDHGGHVVVQTRPGEGACFHVLLPPSATAAEADGRDAAAAAEAPAPRLPGRRVMVVDDEPMVGDFMAELLGGWGLQVLLQRDPLAALHWIETEPAALDLLITDQTMPGLSGLVLAQRARAARPGLPVLLYSGHVDAIDPAECERSGIRAVLAKPVDAEALHALLQRVLAGAG